MPTTSVRPVTQQANKYLRDAGKHVGLGLFRNLADVVSYIIDLPMYVYHWLSRSSVFTRYLMLYCLTGSRRGAVVIVLVSHQCGPGSNSGLGVISGLSLLLVLVLAPRIFLRVLRFSFFSKIDISKFQFDQELEAHGFVSRMTVMCHPRSTKLIYLFINHELLVIRMEDRLQQ